MSARIAAMPSWLARSTFALACLVTGGYALAWLYRAFEPGNPFAARFAGSGFDVPAHFFGAGLALVLAPLQLEDWLRRRWPAVHRTAGWLYAGAILVGGIGGLALAQHAQGGPPTRIAFTLLSLLWLMVTAHGVFLAATGDIARHRTWMAYSVALTASAITLRLVLGTGLAMGLPFLPVYTFAAWACWLFNLAACFLLLRGSRRRARRSAWRPRAA